MMLFVKRSNFVHGHGEKFSPFLQIPTNEMRRPTGLELVHI